MSTPKRPKPLTRHTPRRSATKQFDGGTFGLTHPHYAAEMGFITTYWTHVEDQVMQTIFTHLVAGHANTNNSHEAIPWSAREVFRSIVSQKARITIMRGLLQKAPHNAHLPKSYDETIDEFEAINRIRNDFVHGIWMVETGTEDVFFWNTGAEITVNVEPRIVTIAELQQVSARMRAFMHRVMTHERPPAPSP